ncbi:MAG: DUF5908 family protein [Bacteroidia bacterium]|nr:DUF5908 family protein [Bacteroidia bacterium]
MPIEIRELVIRASVSRGLRTQAPAPGISRREYQALKQELLQACTERMRKLIDERMQR